MRNRNVTETNYNHHDPACAQDPYAIFEKVRSSGCPLGHSEQLGGFYFPTTYGEVKRVFSDFRTFTSSEGAGLPDQLIQLLPVDLDPPRHTMWRRVLNRFFTVEAAAGEQARIQQIADTLVDAFIERGEAEAVSELTQPLLATSMIPIIGAPLEDTEELRQKLLWMVYNRLNDHEGWVRRYQEFSDYMTGLMAERRKSEPREDLLQCLIDEEFEGHKLTDTEGFQVLMLTMFGALESTSSAMSGSLFHLARHPEDKQKLISGAVGWADALEEFLRFTNPIQTLRRQATRDVEVDGGIVPKGANVLAINGAANRDPAKFPEPDKCLIGRDAREHMTFGAGGHICLGRHFARVMLETCLKTVLRRIPDFTVPEDFQPDYTPSEARALRRLPIVFTPGVKTAA